MNLVKRSLEKGGKLAPIVIPKGLTAGTGLMNPSIFIDAAGDILVNLRHVNYTLYHSENHQKFYSHWGPLAYLHPEKDLRLVTENYLCRLNSDLEVTDYTHIEMQSLHTPIWEFVGLEDARLVQWHNEYFLVGVRRDTTTNGQGRMEYSKIEINKSEWKAKEVSRTRIPAPKDDSSYCEKNWVPILDQPFHFVKWTMPTEIVTATPNITECTQVAVKETPFINSDQRGSSHVIPWGNKYISVTHEVNLFNNYLGQKDAIYRHRLCVWDKELNFLGISQPFSFLDARIEFCVGGAVFNGDLLLSFGFQDNAAFVLKTPNAVVEDLIKEALNYVA